MLFPNAFFSFCSISIWRSPWHAVAHKVRAVEVFTVTIRIFSCDLSRPYPAGAPNLKSAMNEKDKIESAYRFLLSDLMPFGKNALIRLEHGGTNDSNEHYETLAYWYGSPAASLVKTDTLDVSNGTSRKQHS